MVVCVACLPACLSLLVVEGGSEKGARKGERKRERGSTAFACTLARSLPLHPLCAAAAAARSRTPSPPVPSPACLPASLPHRHLPPFLLCTCVSAPGVCGRTDRRTTSLRRGVCNNKNNTLKVGGSPFSGVRAPNLECLKLVLIFAIDNLVLHSAFRLVYLPTLQYPISLDRRKTCSTKYSLVR